MNKTYYVIQRLDGQYRTMDYNAETYTLVMGWSSDLTRAKRFDTCVDAVMHKRTLPKGDYWIRTIIVD